MKKDMPLEGLRWSRDSGSALYDTPPNGRSRTGWGECFYFGQHFKLNLTYPIFHTQGILQPWGESPKNKPPHKEESFTRCKWHNNTT